MSNLKYDSLFPIVCNLKYIRKSKGLTQEQLSTRTGISQNSISAMEIGNYNASVKTALILADVLNCKVEDIFTLQK